MTAEDVDAAMAAIWLVERLSESSEGAGATVDEDEAVADADEDDAVVDEDVDEDDVDDEDEDVVEVERVDEDVLDVVDDGWLLVREAVDAMGVGTLLGHSVAGTAIVCEGVIPLGSLPPTMGCSPLSTHP